MSPKVPRDVSGKDLIQILTKFGYEVVRQTGSHIRMSIDTKEGVKNLTVPNHSPVKLGTLMSIINDAAMQLNIEREEITSKL